MLSPDVLKAVTFLCILTMLILSVGVQFDGQKLLDTSFFAVKDGPVQFAARFHVAVRDRIGRSLRRLVRRGATSMADVRGHLFGPLCVAF